MYYEEKVIDGRLCCRTVPNAPFVPMSPLSFKTDVFNKLMLMSKDQRLRMFDHFCKSCGDQNPSCKCKRR